MIFVKIKFVVAIVIYKLLLVTENHVTVWEKKKDWQALNNLRKFDMS